MFKFIIALCVALVASVAYAHILKFPGLNEVNASKQKCVVLIKQTYEHLERYLKQDPAKQDKLSTLEHIGLPAFIKLIEQVQNGVMESNNIPGEHLSCSEGILNELHHMIHLYARGY